MQIGKLFMEFSSTEFLLNISFPTLHISQKISTLTVTEGKSSHNAQNSLHKKLRAD